MPKKIVYLDKPEFHKADPNNPIQYILKPQQQIPQEQSIQESDIPEKFAKLQEMIKPTSSRENPAQNMQMVNNLYPKALTLEEARKRGEVHPGIQNQLNDIYNNDYSDNQLEDIRKQIQSNSEYDQADKDTFDAAMEDFKNE